MVFRLALLTLRLRSPQKALDIGIDLYQVHGDTEAACLAFGYAIRSGHPDLAPAGLWWSAVCLRDRGEHARAVEFFRRTVESGHANWTPRAESDLAELLERQGDVAGARMHYQRAIDFRRDGTDSIWAHRAAVKLEVMLTAHGAVDGARAVHDRATEQGQFDKRMSFAFDRALEWERRGNIPAAIESLNEVIAEDEQRAPAAAFELGHLLRDRGDFDAARAAFQIAVGSGNSAVATQAAAMLDASSNELDALRAAHTDEDDPVRSRKLTVDDMQQLLQKRTVLLQSEIDDAEANRIVAQLLLLEQADPTADIHLWINSPGGYVTAGMAIFDTMRKIRPDVTTWAAGLAAGIAQVLLSEGTPGKRYALPHTRITMWKTTAGSLHPTGLELDILGRIAKEMLAIVAAQTGQSVERVSADSAAERSFSATEALDYGLIDGIRDRLGYERDDHASGL